MITTLKTWRTREELKEIVKKSPQDVIIKGTLMKGGEVVEEKDLYLKDLEYGEKMVVKHKKKTYLFYKGTDGRYKVV